MRGFDSEALDFRAASESVRLSALWRGATWNRCVSSAGTRAGSWIVAGSANVSSSHGAADVTVTDIRVQPTALRLLNTHLAVGGALPLGYSAADGSHSYMYGTPPNGNTDQTDRGGARGRPLAAPVLVRRWI